MRPGKLGEKVISSCQKVENAFADTFREKVESGLEKRAGTDPADPEEKTAGSGSDGTPTPGNGPQ